MSSDISFSDDWNSNNITGGKASLYKRSLNFSSQGVLYIQDESTGQTVWRSTPTDQVTGTYYLQILDSGVFQIVNNQGQQIWAVDITSVSGTASNFNLPGNRMFLSGTTLRNGPYSLTFDGNVGILSIYQTNVQPFKLVWASSLNDPSPPSIFSCSFSTWGNLLIFNNQKETVWCSNTATLVRPAFSLDQISNYNLELAFNGILNLTYEGKMYFQTSATGTSLVNRQPNREFSRSSPYFIYRMESAPQVIMESPDLLTQLVFEPEGRISLYAREQPSLPYSLLSQTIQKGDILYLHGLQSENPDLAGKLVLYTISSTIPVWIFAPTITLSNPLDQLPVTLCFNTQNRLTLITQDQQILSSQSIL